jgi:hypothetical protein
MPAWQLSSFCPDQQMNPTSVTDTCRKKATDAESEIAERVYWVLVLELKTGKTKDAWKVAKRLSGGQPLLRLFTFLAISGHPHRAGVLGHD